MTNRHAADRVAEPHRAESQPDTGRILQQITPQDIRASNQRQSTDRNRDANHPALPQLEICDSRNGPPLSRINGMPFDRNRDGRVTRPELEESFNDPRVLRTFPCAGPAAVALRSSFARVAALYPDGGNTQGSNERHDRSINVRNTFVANERTLPVSNDPNAANPNAHNEYISLNDVVALQRLPENHPIARRVNNEMSAIHTYGRNEGLFDREGQVRPEAVRQGNLGDCTLMSTLASLATNERGRQFLAQMIQPNGDGFRVHFGNGQTIDTARPTQLEMGAYARDSRHGLWPNVLERAFGMARTAALQPNDIVQNVMNFFSGQTAREQLRPHAQTESLSARDVFATVFGDERISVGIPLDSVNDEQLHEQLAGITPHAMAMITATPAAPNPLTFVDRIGGRGGREVLRDLHAYTFDHYDAESRDVYLRNPWHGEEQLRMPLKTFRSRFQFFYAVLHATPE